MSIHSIYYRNADMMVENQIISAWFLETDLIMAKISIADADLKAEKLDDLFRFSGRTNYNNTSVTRAKCC